MSAEAKCGRREAGSRSAAGSALPKGTAPDAAASDQCQSPLATLRTVGLRGTRLAIGNGPPAALVCREDVDQHTVGGFGRKR